MAGKSKNVWVCADCGAESARWSGRCPGCGEWNTLVEELRVTASSGKFKVSRLKSHAAPVLINDISCHDEERYRTGLSELDRVLGGGIVKGSLVLIGGDPGIGKSTLLLQVCKNLQKSASILYVSGEESKRQLRLRADRLQIIGECIYIMTETDVESVIEEIMQKRPDIVIIDSIQTMNHSEISSSTGSVTQVKECTNCLMRTAKSLDIPIVLVGHVNKDGAIAGPKVLEHIVDAVLYFEGDRNTSYRILRGIKNRYGSTNEIGIFQMSQCGLEEVENPSLMLLEGRPKGVSGTCVACIMEGTRPIFAEVQGLAASTGFGNPRRMCTGFDYNRMSLILAVLEKRGGYFFSNLDVYVNVVGGLRLDEPASDLSVAMSLVSSLKNCAVNEQAITFGEIGLAGEVRSVPHALERIAEAARLGFKHCVMPYHNYKDLKSATQNMDIKIIGVRTIREAFEALSR